MTKNMLEKINEVFANDEEITIALHIGMYVVDSDGHGYFDFGYFEFGFDEYDSNVFEEEYNLSKYDVTSVKEDTENNMYHIWGMKNK